MNNYRTYLSRLSDLSELSDRDLWKRFQSDDNLAFEYIYQAYFNKLYNYGCKFSRDKALVEDALHELFLDLKRRGKYLTVTDNILPYLYTAFRRKVTRLRDQSNKFKNYESVNNFKQENSIETAIIEDEIKEEYSKRIGAAIEKLSEKHREIIFLFYYENLSYQEIKEIYGFEHIKSARNLLYKALKSLKQQLKTYQYFDRLREVS